MNGRERVFATLTGAPVDRRAFSPVMSLYGAKLTGCPLGQHYSDAALYARGQAAVMETFHPDILFAPFALVLEGEAFGSQAGFFDHQPPNLLAPAAASAEDVSRLPTPDVDSHPRLLYVREALRRVVAAHGGDVAVAAVVLSPIDLPLMIMGMENWLHTVLCDKDGARRVLDVTRSFFCRWAGALLADGADFLALPAAFLNPAVVTRQMVETFGLPALRDAFADVKGDIVLHHGGAPWLAFMDLYVGLPRVVGYVVDHRDSLSEARHKVGGDAALLGGLDGPNIGKESPEALEARCLALLADRHDDARYILTNSGPDIALDTPQDNIHAIRRAIATF